MTTLPTADPKRADASALLALARAHPEQTPPHLRAVFRKIAAAVPEKRVDKALKPKRDWMMVASGPSSLPLSRNPTSRHERILILVSMFTGISIEEMKGGWRQTDIVDARHISMWLMRQHCRSTSYPIIGRWIGRDHTTVLHGVRKVDGDFPRYKPVIEAVERLL